MDPRRAPESPPPCRTCGKPVKRAKRAGRPWRLFCSAECSRAEVKPPPTELTDAQLEVIETAAAQGCHRDTIGAAIGVSRRELGRIEARDPRTAEALARGRAREHDALVGALYARAVDPKNPSGAAAAMFLLKTRHGYREQAEQQPDNRVSITFALPGALTPAQYEQLTSAIPKQVGPRR